MQSWRELVSADAVADIEAIIDAGFEIAGHALVKNGEVLPFGLTINGHGQRSITHADPGPRTDPAADACLRLLWEGFGQRGVELRAVAAIAEVRDDGHDAIRVEVEHGEGLALTAVRRFERRPDDRFGWASMTLEAGQQRVWLAV